MTLILALTFSITGCGDGLNLGRVEGTVTLDGKPVNAARVRFTPGGGLPSWGETDTDGHYEVMFEEGKPGAIVGEHRVRISTYQFRLDDHGERADIPEIVPAKYNRQTELRRDVVTGRQTIDFELISD